MSTTDEFEAKYPMHVKLKGLNGDNLTVGDFLDFLEENEYVICQFDEDDERYYPRRRRNEQLIGDFFEIDAEALSAEKDAMLEEMRAAYKATQDE